MQRRQFLLLASSACAAPSTWAQTWPNRTVHLINPYAAGGSLDRLARLLAQNLSPRLGQAVVVENRTGSSGHIGTTYVAKSVADGYTLVMASSATHGIHASLFGTRLPYDPLKDFAPVAVATVQKAVLVVHQDVPARTVDELITLLRTRSGEFSFGSPGAGTSQHLSGELFKALAKIESLVHVPYKGSALAMQDLLGGHISMLFVDIPTALPHIRSGRLRALGQTAAQPSPALPDVLPLAQLGLPGFDLAAWYGVMAPAGTPEPVLRRLNSAIIAILHSAETREHLMNIGMEPLPLDLAQSAQYIAAQIERWGEVVRISGATAP